MSRAVLALMVLCLAVSGCGFKRPLIRPKDIPEYEQKRAEKMKKFEPLPAAVDDAQPASLQNMMTPLPPVQQ